MLRVASSARPDCDRLLGIIKKYRNNKRSFQNTKVQKEEANLLNTIKVPKNLLNFENKLPQANYIQTAPELSQMDKENARKRILIQEGKQLPSTYEHYKERVAHKVDKSPIMYRKNLEKDIRSKLRQQKNQSLQRNARDGILKPSRANEPEFFGNRNRGHLPSLNKRLNKNQYLPHIQLRSASVDPSQQYARNLSNRQRNIRIDRVKKADPYLDLLDRYNTPSIPRQRTRNYNGRSRVREYRDLGEDYSQVRYLKGRGRDKAYNQELYNYNQKHNSVNIAYQKYQRNHGFNNESGRRVRQNRSLDANPQQRKAVGSDQRYRAYNLVDKYLPDLRSPPQQKKYYSSRNPRLVGGGRSILRNADRGRSYKYKRPDWWG